MARRKNNNYIDQDGLGGGGMALHTTVYADRSTYMYVCMSDWGREGSVDIVRTRCGGSSLVLI
jgi:hypothetical protein